MVIQHLEVMLFAVFINVDFKQALPTVVSCRGKLPEEKKLSMMKYPFYGVGMKIYNVSLVIVSGHFDSFCNVVKGM